MNVLVKSTNTVLQPESCPAMPVRVGQSIVLPKIHYCKLVVQCKSGRSKAARTGCRTGSACPTSRRHSWWSSPWRSYGRRARSSCSQAWRCTESDGGDRGKTGKGVRGDQPSTDRAHGVPHMHPCASLLRSSKQAGSWGSPVCTGLAHPLLLTNSPQIGWSPIHPQSAAQHRMALFW